MTEPTQHLGDAAQATAPVRSVLMVAPEASEPRLPLRQPLPWPYFESNIDAQSVIGKLATFTPNVDATLTLVMTSQSANSALWRCPGGLTNHLAMIDVLSTAAFLNDWNLRTGFIEFADPAAALGDLIFQMKQLAAMAIRRDEKLYIETRGVATDLS
ncbi:MAG TPA: hypothetical protein VKQ06_04805 [Gammaproteobacteria bacterium]|nr:hypothetical protein [Gammaproteobacteria bacterium]